MALKKNMPTPKTLKKPKKSTPTPAPIKRRKRDGKEKEAEGKIQPAEEAAEAPRLLGPLFEIGQRVVHTSGMQSYRVVSIDRVPGTLDDWHVHARFGVTHMFDLQTRFKHAD